MKNKFYLRVAGLAGIFCVLAVAVSAQTLAKRTAFKTETVDFGMGGTVTVTGAPFGSIRIEGWNRNEIEISAEIEIQAPTEADLAMIAGFSGFVLDSSFNHLRVTSVGPHDKTFLKKRKIKLPKHLVGLPFKIDYVLKVPRFCDLNIDGGAGNFSLVGVDGNMRINYVKGDAKMSLDGGAVQAVFGEGNVEIAIPTRSWRGRFADIQLSRGNMSIALPVALNASVSATILRTGQIENSVAAIKPRTRNDKFTEKSIIGNAGNGGIPITLTVGDGTMKIFEK